MARRRFRWYRVSLLVGGREIGLKRALGARRRDIVTQLLAAALLIAVSGALLGVALGAVAAALAAWSVAWSPLMLMVAVPLCVGVGLAFGNRTRFRSKLPRP
jgi:putative ABC transport system permease protein